MRKTGEPRTSAGTLLATAFQVLADAGGSLPLQELLKAIAQRLPLTDYDRHVYDKTGYVRWVSTLHFFSVECVKAGFLAKTRGVWHLTDEGRRLLGKPGDELLQQAREGYNRWLSNRGPDPAPVAAATEAEAEPRVEQNRASALTLEDAQSRAQSELVAYLLALTPYEFQDLAAALLRGMGYHTPFVAPKGPDGGIDIIAYRDPLGSLTPHIRVQVKHKRETKASREDIAALRGMIRQDREVGLFISTAGFTADARREARHGAVHIEMLDLERLIDLWIEHYEKLSEEDRSLLRLVPVHFLAPEQ